MFQISKCPRVTVVLSYWEASGEVSKLSYKSLLFDSSRRSYCSLQNWYDSWIWYTLTKYFYLKTILPTRYLWCFSQRLEQPWINILLFQLSGAPMAWNYNGDHFCSSWNFEKNSNWRKNDFFSQNGLIFKSVDSLYCCPCLKNMYVQDNFCHSS